MMIFPLMFSLNTSIGLNLAIALGSNVILVAKYRKQIEWKVVIPCSAVSVVLSVISARLSLSWNQTYIKMFLGLVLVVLAIYFYAFSERITMKATPRNGAIAGIFGGLGNGLFGIAGPPVALYFAAALTDTRTYIGSIQCYFLLINISGALTRAFSDAFIPAHYVIIAVGWVMAFMGTRAGVKYFEKLPEATVRRLFYLAIGVSGLITFLQSLSALI